VKPSPTKEPPKPQGPRNPDWEQAWNKPHETVQPKPVGNKPDGKPDLPNDKPGHDNDGTKPPRDSDIHIEQNGDGNVAIVNVTKSVTINNTVVNVDNRDQTYFLKNFNTGVVLQFHGRVGQPMVLPSGWCGNGGAGQWALSGSISVPGFAAAASISGGYLNVNNGCGYVPPPPPPPPIVFNCDGYLSAPVTNYYYIDNRQDNRRYVYYNNTTLVGTVQYVQGQQEFKVEGYTYDAVQQPVVQGYPKYLEKPGGGFPGVDGTEFNPLFMWLSVFVVLLGGGSLLWLVLRRPTGQGNG